MNEEMQLAWLEISQMLGEPTREELDVFLRTWQRASQATREALAEQPAQQALDKMAENARELGLDYEPQAALRKALAEQPARPYRLLQDNGSKYFGDSWDKAEQPAQQEPVAWLHPANATCVTTDPTAYARGIPLYTSPPAQRTWVGLTDEEIKQAMDYWSSDEHSAYGGAASAAGEYFDVETSWRYIEAKLKEKNT